MKNFVLNKENSYVLAVEDSLVQARKLEYFFHEHEISFKLFNNAEDAYDYALANPPKIIISDIIMPGMDGYEFCTKVKATPHLKFIPVILLTALQDPQDIIKGLQAGADNFITKPYDEKYLLSRIQYLIINSDIRQAGNSEMVIELVFRDQKYQINSDKKQILDLLLSVYEVAIQRNDQLTAVKSELESAIQDLTAANQDLEAFTRMVSHDLRTPLNGIISLSELLITNQSDEISQESLTMLQFVNESAISMGMLINDLLAFARSGNTKLNKEIVNLSEIASEVMSRITALDPKNKITFKITPQQMAFADKGLIRIVFDNLLGNAVKYSSKVENPEIIFGVQNYFGHNLYFVKDNGAGFDSSKADKLFQPFQRFHSSSEFKGTGVGLSTVKKVIDKHGGTIWAESEIGKGTTFYFTLPDAELA